MLLIGEKNNLKDSGFLSETTEFRSWWHKIFQVLKKKNFQPRILYPEKIYLRNQATLG